MKIHWKSMLQRVILLSWRSDPGRPLMECNDMTTIHMAPGATVITGRTHGGLERMTTGVGILAATIAGAIRALDTWREARIEAHNDAMLVEIAAHDPRVLAELRAARDRALG
jgi:hypothetical protein